MLTHVIVAVLVLMSSAATVRAQGTPSQLVDKTIQVTFTIGAQAKGADGSNRFVQRSTTQLIYVSSAGRVFARELRQYGQRADSLDRGPESGSSSGTFRFGGGKLVGTVQHQSGARQVVVSFDTGFGSCTANVSVGRDAGRPFVWTGLDGVSYTATGPVETTSPTCSIRAGNAFGS